MKRKNAIICNLTGNDSGASLIVILVGIGVSFIVYTQVTRLATHSFKYTAKISQIGELAEIRKLIRLRTDCQNTLLQTSGGTNQQSFQLFDQHNQPILPISGGAMVLGTWRIRARPTGSNPVVFQVSASNSVHQESDLFRAPDSLTCPNE